MRQGRGTFLSMTGKHKLKKWQKIFIAGSFSALALAVTLIFAVAISSPKGSSISESEKARSVEDMRFLAQLGEVESPLRGTVTDDQIIYRAKAYCRGFASDGAASTIESRRQGLADGFGDPKYERAIIIFGSESYCPEYLEDAKSLIW